MVMADSQIARAIQDSEIKIFPLPHPDQIQPASLDVSLGESFITFSKDDGRVFDPSRGILPEGEKFTCPDQFVLRSGEFVLANTLESIGLPDDIVARVEGCSSLGRLGLLVHVTAGFIDPGWPLAQITLELCNVVSFERLEVRATRPYGSSTLNSHYANQNGVTASRYGKV